MGRDSRGHMTGLPGRRAAQGALLLSFMACALAAAPVRAMQVLDVADHGELSAEVSATGVSRIALEDDRIARVIRSPGGFAVEHDAARGDLYLKPLDGEAPAGPVTLFVGTEKGFTYRLALAPVERDSAQVLIRNADAAPERRERAGGRRIAELVALVAAVARREAVPGYAIDAGGSAGGLDTLERWRGARFEALVLELGPGGPSDAAALAARLGAGIAAAWVSAPGAGGGRLAVAVRERGAPDRSSGQAGGVR